MMFILLSRRWPWLQFLMEDLWLNVWRWLVRPIRVQKALPHVAYTSMGAAVEVEVAWALHAAHFIWASVMCLFSAMHSPVVILHPNAKDTLRQSLKHFLRPQLCADVVFHTPAVLAVDCLAFLGHVHPIWLRLSVTGCRPWGCLPNLGPPSLGFCPAICCGSLQK